MNKTLKYWQLAEFLFVSAFGSFLHFLYEISGNSVLAAPFSAVNESTWEHMKLLFFPMLIFAFIESFFIKKDYPDFWCVKLKGVLIGLALIPVLFYTYNGVFGKSPDFVNIGIFLVSAAAAAFCESKLFTRLKACRSGFAAFAALIIIAAAFAVFTFLPPALPIFQSPV